MMGFFVSLVKSLAQAIGIKATGNPVKACLSELDRKTGQESGDGKVIGFQYFPETIQDIQSARYSERDVPGGSHPIIQYLGAGSRSLSFTAFFTQENNPEKNSLLTGLLTGTASFSPLTSTESRADTVDIPSAIKWLRSYICPNYENGFVQAPPVAILYLPNSGIIGYDKFKDSVTCVMTQCDVTYEAFHRNGAPRIVAVSLSFTETMQVGSAESGWQFQGREKFWTKETKDLLLKSKAMQGQARNQKKSTNLADSLGGGFGG